MGEKDQQGQQAASSSVAGEEVTSTRVATAREQLRAAILELDAALSTARKIPAREPNELLTHAIVVTAWSQIDAGDEDEDTTALTDYYMSPTPAHVALGMVDAVAYALRRAAIDGDRDDPWPR